MLGWSEEGAEGKGRLGKSDYVRFHWTHVKGTKLAKGKGLI